MEQCINNSEANSEAKRALEIIRNFLIDSHMNDTKAKKEAEKTGDLYVGHSYMNKNSQSKMFHAISNLFEGLKYQKKQKRIRRERRRGRARILAEGDEEDTISADTDTDTETEVETTQTTLTVEYKANRELKSLVDDVGSIALEGYQIQENINIRTSSFAYEGEKMMSKDLPGKSLSSTSSRVSTPSTDLGLSSMSAKFQYSEWDKNPLDGHPQTSSSITNTLDFSLYDEGVVQPISLTNTKLPFYFLMKVILPTSEHYCAYFNEQTQKYSDQGMKLVYKRLVENGTGLILCSANHLSQFAALKNAPAEHIDVLTKSNYDVLSKIGSYTNYNYLNSPGIYIYIYRYIYS